MPYPTHVTADTILAPVCGAPADTAMAVESLPFTIRRVETEDDLLKAVRIRHAAYARHVPEFARSLTAPEAADYASDTVVLLAESRLDGSPLGSIRICTNALRPLGVEEPHLDDDTRRLSLPVRGGVEVLADGRARVRVGAPTARDIARTLAGWGGAVEVLEPVEVRAELARIASELSALYPS